MRQDATSTQPPPPIGNPVTVVTGLTKFGVALLSVIAAGATAIAGAFGFGALIYLPIQPECSGSGEMFCGLGELFVAGLAGLVGGAVVGFFVARSITRVSLPRPVADEVFARTMLVVVGLPALLLLLALAG